LEEAETEMAKTDRQALGRSNVWAAKPAENITRVSNRKSAAVAQAEPTAIPTSTELRTQGVDSGFSPQTG
jgi:hypothetical protein